MYNLRSQFPILKTQLNRHGLIYMDSAATSQKPQEVIDAITEFYTTHNASSHSVHSLGGKVTEMVEETRQVVADFLASDVSEIIFTSGATDGINLIANGFLEVSLRGENNLLINNLEQHPVSYAATPRTTCRKETLLYQSSHEGNFAQTLSSGKSTPSGFACHPSRGESYFHSFNNHNPFCLNSDSEILICVDQHHSNILPWQRLAEIIGCKIVFFGILPSGQWDMSDFQFKLNFNTKVIAISNVSNVVGVVQDVGAMNDAINSFQNQTNPTALRSPLTRGNNPQNLKVKNNTFRPIVVLDATQAVSHLPIDVKELDVDFVVFSGHKIYGPTGVGVLYGRRELLEVLPNYKVGGDMVESVTLEKNIYKEVPYRFEAGTANFASIIGLKAALNWFIRSQDKIFKIENELYKYLIEKLLEIEGLEIVGQAKNKNSPLQGLPATPLGRYVTKKPCSNSTFANGDLYLDQNLDWNTKNLSKSISYKTIPLASFNIKGVNSLDLALLLDQKGVCIRSGQHCAGILHEYLQIDSSCRISLACFNTKVEIDYTIKNIQEICIKIRKL